MNSYEIVVSGVVKTFGQNRLGPFELNIEPGVVVAFVGPNGSGKTTLLQMLMNVVLPDQGTIRVFGEAYEQREIKMKRRIGYVADSSFVEEEKSSIEEVMRFHSHWFPSWSADKWAELCVRFGLNPREKVNRLSKGMKRRLSFCLAIAQMPQLLILDEPSSGLDPFIWRMMIQEIQEFMDGGKRTVLIATHTIEEVRRLADYVAFIHDGKLVLYEEKDAILDAWRALWIEAPHVEPERLPGVVEWERGALTRLVTQNAFATEAALQSADIPVVKRQAIELDEILHYIVAMKERTDPSGSGTKRGERTQ